MRNELTSVSPILACTGEQAPLLRQRPAYSSDEGIRSKLACVLATTLPQGSGSALFPSPNPTLGASKLVGGWFARFSGREDSVAMKFGAWSTNPSPTAWHAQKRAAKLFARIVVLFLLLLLLLLAPRWVRLEGNRSYTRQYAEFGFLVQRLDAKDFFFVWQFHTPRKD